jgi:hypothetical protein
MIMVDPARRYPAEMFKGRARIHRNKVWCHMTSDTSEEELHEFAAEVGLKYEWFQKNHYDLTGGMRARAISFGAQEVSTQELVRRCYAFQSTRLDPATLTNGRRG